MELHHALDECAGQWVRGGAGWQCTGCGAAHPVGDLRAREAIWREYELELLFFRLGAQGRLLLRTEQSPPRAPEEP